MKPAPINDSFMALLEEYSDKTGVPVSRCVADALFEWLAKFAPVTLRRLGLAPLNMPFIARAPVQRVIGRRE
jgi:hypothetical protein